MYIIKTASYQFSEFESAATDYGKLLQQETDKSFRRTDQFIKLALLGACNIGRQIELNESTAVYLCSGQGNITSFNQIKKQCIENKKPPSPVTFLNSLNSTLRFYINNALNVSGKSIFTFQQKFIVESLLSLANWDIKLKKEERILLGGVDEIIRPTDIGRKILGVNNECLLGEGSNWLLLSEKPEDALSKIILISPELEINGLYIFLKESLSNNSENCLIFSDRVKEQTQQEISQHFNLKQPCYSMLSNCYYETNLINKIINFSLNSASTGIAFFINCFENTYKVVVVRKTKPIV